MATPYLYQLEDEEIARAEQLLLDVHDAQGAFTAFVNYLLDRRGLPRDAMLNLTSMAFVESPKLSPQNPAAPKLPDAPIA